MRVSLKSVLAAGLAAGAIAYSASAAPLSLSSTVNAAPGLVPQTGGPYQLTDPATPYDFTALPYATLTSIDSISVIGPAVGSGRSPPPSGALEFTPRRPFCPLR